MQIEFRDIQDSFGQDAPHSWERLWHALVVADATRGGVPFHAIHWDERTSTPDGGQDILVEHGASPPSWLVPAKPSTWSIKSGKNGLKVPTLAKELDPKSHPKILEALRKGEFYIYCVCHLASPEQRDELKTEAVRLASAHNFPPESVRFYFTDHLCDALRRYPGVLHRFCPKVGLLRASSFTEWSQPNPHFDTKAEYVTIGERGTIIKQLAEHMTGVSLPAVRHIAGFSGIGKTRMVFEACRDSRVADSVTYFASYADCTEHLNRLRKDESLSAIIVTDEVPYDDYVDIRNALAGLQHRIRCVTIGPAQLGDLSRDGIMVLPAPAASDEVFAVLRNNAPTTLPDAILLKIANNCVHDLRFGLLILASLLSEPESASTPDLIASMLIDAKVLFGRVLRLFSSGPGGLDAAFADRYTWLTLCAYLDVAGEQPAELKYLADAAGVPLQQMRQTVSTASQCGLGDRSAHLFQAVPRGMASRLFADVLWPRIDFTFKSLLKNAPNDRFRRSIMQRVEQCPERIRKEVAAELADHFRASLSHPSIDAVDDIERVRTVCRWVELEPDSGLAWLGGAIGGARLDRLRAFQGAGSGWGPSGPRREIVFLLEHLACFREHFDACEAMLFRLAIAENERIANNAEAVWAEKFRIYFSNTEVPYPERAALLLKRLNKVTPESVGVLLKGLESAVTPPHSAMAPPDVIGGRLVPPEWKPEGHDVYTLFVDLIRPALRVLSGWPSDLRRKAWFVVMGALSSFYKQGTHQDLVEFFRPLADPDDKRSLVTALDDLEDRLRRHEKPSYGELADQLKKWSLALAPRALDERVKMLLSRPVWSLTRSAGQDRDAWRQPYTDIARELSDLPDTLRVLGDWIENDGREGARPLGWALAEVEVSSVFRPIITEWLRAGRTLELGCGYLAECRNRNDGQFPDWSTRLLDELVTTLPSVAARVTVDVDASAQGFQRIHRCIDADRAAALKELSQLYGSRWEPVLGAEGQAWVLDQLWPDATDRSQGTGAAALHIAEMYRYALNGRPLDPQLLPPIRRLVHDPPELRQSHAGIYWQHLAIALAETEPESVLRTVLRRALDYQVSQGDAVNEAVAVVATVADSRPDLVIKGLISTMSSLKKFMPIKIEAWQGVFAKLPVEVLAPAVGQAGIRLARRIGQVMPDPTVNDDGTAALPPVTAWYLHTHGEDSRCFQEFSVGRWNGRMRYGSASQRSADVQRLAAAYEHHEIKALRQWAKNIREQHQRELDEEKAERAEEKRW